MLRENEEYEPAAKENDGQTAFKIRMMPENVDDRITRRYFGDKVRQKFLRGAQVFDHDRRKNTAARLDKGCWSLLDSINLSVTPRDEGYAKIVSAAVGREVKIGETVSVDGHWTDDLKKAIFNQRTTLLLFVLKRAGILAAEDAETEEGKEEG
jgi:hypothetical protein